MDHNSREMIALRQFRKDMRDMANVTVSQVMASFKLGDSIDLPIGRGALADITRQAERMVYLACRDFAREYSEAAAERNKARKCRAQFH